jgi:hypothetical protein
LNNFYRISTLDTVPLMAAIARQPELWREDTYLRDYPQGPFGEVETIMLRFPERSVHETEEALREHLANVDQHESVDQPAYAKLVEARQLVMSLMAYVQGERLGRVMINKIKPGGRIFPHADTDVHAAYYTRHHIVIHGLPGARMRCADEHFEMLSGSVFWFNNALEHEVINNSADDRVSMVVDIRTRR